MYGYEKLTTDELNLLIEVTINENRILAEEEPIGIPGYTWKETIAAYEFNQITIDCIQRILKERNEGNPFTDDEKQTMLMKEYVIFRRICNSDSMLKNLLSSRIFDIEKSLQSNVLNSVFEMDEVL